MAPEAAIQNAPRRTPRWLQFGVRTFLVGVAVFSVWLGFMVNSARRQQAAVAMIEGRYGEVCYDYEHPAVVWTVNGRTVQRSSVPTWLLNRVGKDAFHDVVVARTYDNNDDAEYLDALPDLVELDMFQPTDAAIARIGTLRRLESLALSDGSLLSPQGADHLKGARALKYITLGEVAGMNDGDSLLRTLSKLPHLRSLRIRASNVTDSGLSVVPRMQTLEWMDVERNADVTDVGLKHLINLPALSGVTLSQTSVTDKGVLQLKSMPTLQYVRIYDCEIRDIAALRAALPHCNISE